MASTSLVVHPVRSLPSRAWRSLLHRDRPIRVLAVGAAATGVFIALAEANTAGQGVLWDNAHWTISAGFAVVAGGLGAWATTGVERRVRGWIAVGLGLWFVGQLVWDIESVGGQPAIGTWADVFFLAMPFPGLLALRSGLLGRLRASARIAVYLDSLAVVLAIGSVIAALVEPAAIGIDGFHAVLHVAYPVLFFGTGGAGLVGAIAIRAPARLTGSYAIVAGAVLMGVAWTGWLMLALHGTVDPSAIADPLFSIALLLGGLGAATWSLESSVPERGLERFLERVGPLLPIGAAQVATVVLVLGAFGHDPTSGLPSIAAGLALLSVIARQTVLLGDRVRMSREVEAVATENARLVAELEARIVDMHGVQGLLISTSKRAAVGELAAAVAHEVNNPLTGVLGYAELLLAAAPSPGSPHDELEIIRSEALRARTIIRSLLEFAHPKTPERRPTEVADLARGTIDLMRYHLVRGGATIDEDYAALPPIELDADAIRQALLNVLSNAAQAIGPHGRIVVTTRLDGSFAVLSVADDGVGMDAETIDRAFIPFFTTRPVREGTGLGLAVAQSIVEVHGGRIRIVSAVGEGTVVEIRLPVDAPALAEGEIG